MSTFSKTFALGLFLLVNACGASAISASSRAEGGGGGPGPAAGFGPVVEPRTPPNVENRVYERQVDHEPNTPRETPAFRYETDCWRCL